MLQIQLRLDDRWCLVVGGGRVGTRRTRTLVEAGCPLVVVVDPNPASDLDELADAGSVQFGRHAFTRADLFDPQGTAPALVVASTDVEGVNEAVARLARTAGIPVNRADMASAGDIAFPASFRRGPVTVGVSTSGRAPAVGRWVSGLIEAGFDDLVGIDEAGLTLLTDLVVEVRAELGDLPEGVPDGLDWRRAFDGSILDLVNEGRRIEAKEAILACLSS